ncbi:MAG TPA: hypothetical protein VGR57_19670, partial [Ktedonobacterales bacterium]|nr:hypothetical protein [Ktedonobacterales bacterium]
MRARAGGVGDPARRAPALTLARPGVALLFASSAVVFIVNLPAQAAYLRALFRASLAPTGPAGGPFAALLRSLGVTESRFVAFTMTLLVATMVVNFLVSGLILWRRVDDRMALLAAATAVASGVVGPLATLAPANSALITAGPWRLLNQSLTFVALLSVGTFVVLFPSGTFVPRWTRWLLVVMVPVILLYAFLPSILFAPALVLPRSALILSAELCVIYAQIYRYRRVSSAIERQQTKWVSLVFIASLTINSVETIAPWLVAPLHLTSAQ